MKPFSPALLLLALAACTNVGHVMDMGPDTYNLSARAPSVAGGQSSAREAALAKAKAHCEALGRNLLVSNMEAREVEVNQTGEVNLTFQCLATNDTTYQRPGYASKMRGKNTESLSNTK